MSIYNNTEVARTSSHLRHVISDELYNGEHEIPEGQEKPAREALLTIANRICDESGPDSDEYKTAWAKYENTIPAWNAFIDACAKAAGMST